MSREVLLLGGTGLIGAACARALVAAGHRVTVVVRGQRPVVPGCTVVIADRNDDRSLAAALAGRRADLTVDLLAYTEADVRRALDVPGFSPGRFVMISTGQVYLVAADRRPPFVEADADRPAMPEPEADTRAWHNWAYGMGKRGAEAEVWRRRAGGLDALVLRLPVVQGAGDGSRRLWAYLQRMLDGGPILLPDGGVHPVRFVWADDVGRVVASLVDARPPSFAYNVAMPDEPTLRDLLSRVAAAVGCTPRFVSCTWDDLAGIDGLLDGGLSPFSGPWCSRPDPSLIRRELGFEPTPSEGWIPAVVAAHLAEPEPASHAGYGSRALEIALADALSG